MAGEVPRVSPSPCYSSCQGDTPRTPTPPAPAPTGTGTLDACRKELPATCRTLSCAGHLAHTQLGSLPHLEPGLAVPLHRPDRRSKAQRRMPRPPRGWVLGEWQHVVSLMIVCAGSLPVPEGSRTSRYTGTFGTGAPQTSPLLLVSHLGPCVQMMHLIVGERASPAPTPAEVWNSIPCLGDPEFLQVRPQLPFSPS